MPSHPDMEAVADAFRSRTTRLSASRVLRAKKIMAFIFDKLELGHRGRSGSVVSINSRITPNPRAAAAAAGAPAELPGSPPTTTKNHDSPFPTDETFSPEDVIELVCGMQPVDPKITLATLKQYYGAGGDMLLHYKLKDGVKVSK